MEKSKKLKLFIGLSYLILLSVFLYLFFSKFSFQEITSYDFIKENRLYFLEVRNSNLFLIFIIFLVITILLLSWRTLSFTTSSTRLENRLTVARSTGLSSVPAGIDFLTSLIVLTPVPRLLIALSLQPHYSRFLWWIIHFPCGLQPNMQRN